VLGSLAVLGGGGFALYWFVLKNKPTDPTIPVEEAPEADVDADAGADVDANTDEDAPELEEAPEDEDLTPAEDDSDTQNNENN
jgi:hypothetical protein